MSADRTADIQHITERLAAIGALEDGWLDGDGKKPTVEAIETARCYLTRYLSDFPTVHRPSVYPDPDGGVQAEWSLGEVEIEVIFTATGGMVAEFQRVSEDHMTTTNHETRLVEAIKEGASSGAVTAAVTFLRQLPARAQASAEFAPAAGDVFIDWTAGGWELTVAVDERFEVSYSGTFGHDGRLRGWQKFNGPLHHVLVAAINMMVDRKWELGELARESERA